MKRRVLVVDDDPDTRLILREVLAEFDAEVYEAAHDDEAFQRYLEVGPDLMLIDVLLPRKGGLSLLRRIRSARGGKDLPVCVMSAVYRGADLRAETTGELGAIDFFKKPFQLDSLRTRFGELLSKPDEEGPEVVTPFAPTTILNRGSLKNTDFPALLKDLGFHRATACLNLRWGVNKKVLFFQDGEITFALSNQLRETLGRHLLGRGKIDDDAYRAGLEAVQRDKKKMGEFFIAQGILEPNELFEAVRRSVFAKVLDVFTWQGGDFRLSAYAAPPAVLPGQPFDVNHTLWEGIKGPFPYDRLTASLGPYLEFSLRFQRDLSELAAEIPLRTEDRSFLRLVRRLRGQLLKRLLSEVQGEHEVRFLYYLLLRGYLGLTRGESEGTDLREIDAADLERIRRSRRRLDRLKTRNYFQVLDLPLETTDEKVREAYLHIVKDVHPDMLDAREPAELKQLHGETFRIVQTAYDALKTVTRRREYLKFIQEGIEEEVTDGSRILEAETLFQQGRFQLKKRNWEGAAEAFQKALELNPDEGEYSLYLGLVKVRQAVAGDQSALLEAEDLLQKARAMLPNSPEPYHQLGRLALVRGDVETATSYFRSALARRPNHVEALRELRLIKARSEKKSGVLGTLLGRKEKQ